MGIANMNLKSKEYSIIKMLLLLTPEMTVAECGKRLKEIRSKYLEFVS